MNEIYLIFALLAIFIVSVSTASFYLMPKFNGLMKALIGSFLIPYLSIVIIVIGLINTSLIKKIKYKGFFSFLTLLKECFFTFYLGTGLFVVTIVIFGIWFYRFHNR